MNVHEVLGWIFRQALTILIGLHWRLWIKKIKKKNSCGLSIFQNLTIPPAKFVYKIPEYNCGVVVKISSCTFGLSAQLSEVSAPNMYIIIS